MAKGRKLPASRSERLLGSYSYDQSHGTVNGGSELAEDDVWSTVNGMVNGDDQSSNNTYSEWVPRPSTEARRSFSIRSRRHRQAGGEDGYVGGLSLAFDDPGKTASPRIVHQIRGQEFMASPRGRHMATSAPVNVPDWTKIYRVDSVESLHESDDGDDRDFDMVPPHEYLARSRNSAANSVFEGIGRTLKGRDLSRVRDAVWSQTGFNG